MEPSTSPPHEPQSQPAPLPEGFAARTEIRRPVALLAVLGAVGAAFAAVGVGLSGLSAERKAPAAAILADQPESVAEALDAAPWIAAPAGAGAQIVWALAPAACVGCADFHRETVARLAAEVGAVRAIVAPSTDPVAAQLTVVAGLAKMRDWQAYRAFAVGDDRSAMQAAPKDPAEAEGFALWAQASMERLAALGVPLDQPVVLWRSGAGWRMLAGKGALDAGVAQRAIALDLAAMRP